MRSEATRQGAGRKGQFVVGTYNKRNELEQVPKELLCRDLNGDCNTGIHGWRVRKQGPAHALAVVACKAHKRYCTVYPPGWVPYARERLWPRVCSWLATLFVAVLDLAKGRRWPLQSPPDGGCWRTQYRHVRRLERSVGLGPDVSRQDAERAAQTLNVPLAAHMSRWRCGWRPDLITRCKAIEATFRSLRAEAWLLLLVVGHQMGCCGASFWVDTETARLRRIRPSR